MTTLLYSPLTPGVQDFDGQPVDDQRVIGGADRHGGEPAVDRRCSLAACDGLAVFLRAAPARYSVIVWCDAGLHVKMKLPPGLLDGGGDRLAGEQIIAEETGRRRRTAEPCRASQRFAA